MKFTPRLRTIFFIVNIMILLLPLGGIVLLRLYESVLIRRTEIELVVQGAVVAAAFRQEVRRELSRPEGAVEGPTDASEPPYGVPLPPTVARSDETFLPVEARLDLATNRVRPRPEDARQPVTALDPIAAAAGESITPIMRDAQRVTLAGIRVVDFRGTVAATTRTELGMSLAHREEVAAALEGDSARLMRTRISDSPQPALESLSRGTRLRVFVSIPIIEDERLWGAVILSRTPEWVDQSLYRIRVHLLLGAVTLLAMVIIISILTSWTISRPVRQLIAQTERVARGEKGAAAPLARPGSHEINQVSVAVARMARALEERSDYIRTFASSVSHEFKTPLTSIRGAVELLRDHLDDMTPEERERFLHNLEQDAERLDRLVSRLTDLARADVIKPGETQTEVAPVIDGLVEHYKDQGLSIEASHGQGVSTASMQKEPLESILTNLIDNARQHGGPEVHVVVAAEVPHSDGRSPKLMLSVSDDGPGISKANLERVFNRFFTTAREQGGSGLGLAIVKSLVDVHLGTIQVESAPGRTVFRVELPCPAQDRSSTC